MSNKAAEFFHHIYLMNGSITNCYMSGEDSIIFTIRRSNVNIIFTLAWINDGLMDEDHGFLQVRFPRPLKMFDNKEWTCHSLSSISELIEKLEYYGLLFISRKFLDDLKNTRWPWPKSSLDFPRPTL